MAQIGPISFCLSCGCYAESVSRGLLDECLGKPVTNTEMGKSRRHKKKWLLEGRRPLTGKPLPGAEPGQLARLERWRLQEQEEACQDPRPPKASPAASFMPPAEEAATAVHGPELRVVHDRPGREESMSGDLRARPVAFLAVRFTRTLAKQVMCQMVCAVSDYYVCLLV